MDESGARHLLAELERYADGLLVNFTGREWLVERVRAWQADPYAKPFLLIQGTAGIGKSAFAAHLWRTQRMVTAVHFCIAGRGGTTEPLTFVEVLSAQLAAALSGFAEVRRRVIDAYARQTVQIQAEVQTGEVHPGGRVTGVAVQFRLESIPPEQAFDLLIRRPLREVAAAGELPPVLLLVDALDEALTHHTPPAILHLLQKSGDLPLQVRWVLTSRPEPRVTQALADLPVEILDAADPRHQADVRQYLCARVGELEQTARAWGMGRDALVEHLGQRSEWNFLYLTSVWPDLAEGRIPSPEKLPVGLDGYYRYLLDTRVGAAAWGEWGADLMEVLLALQEPVDLATLACFLGWEPRLTYQRALRVAQVLSPALLQAGRYFRHHWSLAEFLRDRARAGPWWCDLTGRHRQIAESILSGWGGLEAGLPGLRRIKEANYGTRHLVAHLIEGGQYEQAASLLRLEWEESPHPVHVWYTVHERIGTLQDFERDLQRAWKTVSAINRSAAQQGQTCSRLEDEVRYALIQASLNSLADNIPPALVVALVEKNLWLPTQGLSWIKRMPNEHQQVEALIGILPYLPMELIDDALNVAQRINHPEKRARALIAAASFLYFEQKNKFWQRR